MFRYVRYNTLGLRRPAPTQDDETATSVEDVKRRTPRRAQRLGILDPETSLIIWQDDVVDAVGATSLSLETSLADPPPLLSEL